MIEISDIIKEPKYAFGVAAGAVIRQNYEYADEIFNRLLETYAANREFPDTETDFKKGIVKFFFKPLLEQGKFSDVINYSEKIEVLNEEWKEFLRYIKSAAKMSHADKTEGEKTKKSNR